MNDRETAEWRAKVRAEYGPGADDLTPDEEAAYDAARTRQAATKPHRVSDTRMGSRQENR